MKRKTTSLIAGVLAALACVGAETAAPERRDLATMKEEQASATPAQILDWLKSGNERFASGTWEGVPMVSSFARLVA